MNLSPDRNYVGYAFAFLVRATMLLLIIFFVWILFDALRFGWERISFSFLIESPRNAGRAGGIGPVIASTLGILAVCNIVALPLGIGTAVFLAEYIREGGFFGRFIRRSLDALAGTPSIVFGLFGNAFFTIYLGLGYSILSGGLTLACMILPILIRSTEEGLRAVPAELRMSAGALGFSRHSALYRLMLPFAAPAIASGLILGTGRALAETAALLFTSGYVDRMPHNLLDPGRSLAVHVYDLAMNVPGGENGAYASVLILIAILILINLGLSYLTKQRLGGKLEYD